ncbi:Txe/YoeB family addiction module toxin [soil metagenome]
MRKLVFEPEAVEHLDLFAAQSVKLHSRATRLVLECLRDPFGGIAKPEPLKGRYSGLWSRRINDEHRLVYEVTGTEIRIVRLFGHYED